MGLSPGGLAHPRTHGGNLWEVMRQHGFSKDQILDFSVDVNPFGFPQRLPSIIRDHLDDLRYYPDPCAQALREAIASYHQVPTDAVLPGNGAAELIGLAVQLRQPKKALVVVPAFGEYEWALEQIGATCVRVETREASDFQLDDNQDDWQQLFADVEMVFVCNPNNPTGAVAPRGQVLRLAHRCRDIGALLVVDEAFVDFVEHPDALSVLHDAIPMGHVVVLRSLTKCFAIPGLRLGYAVACASLIEELRALQQPWPINTFAAAVGVQLFKETAYMAQSRRAIAQLRDEFQQLLSTVPWLQPFPSATNFVLCKLTSPGITASPLADRLARQGLLIRTCDSFTGLEPGRFIRLAVRCHADNHRLIGALREVLADGR